MSIYCIRKYGWFESGWTSDFLKKCFDHGDLDLTILPGIGLDNGDIGVATRKSNKMKITSKNVAIPYSTEQKVSIKFKQLLKKYYYRFKYSN